MHEFEEFLARLLGGVIRDIQLRIGDDGQIIRLGELRGGEERRIPLDMGDCEHVCVGYSYVRGVELTNVSEQGKLWYVQKIRLKEVKVQYW
ncbi:hypothetical protein VitviT2T_011368 [Vitis vinifera]|uniref:Uncharacterized protein n=1 Tax=Vitis vinifera TaxID=29760 RepID=A0ABY9CD71_VITVI|nr:hypothetical protein VitviT2T_011368 [Vitis vinifera]